MSEAQHSTAPAGIVVGVDGSPMSVEALRWAARLAPVFDGPITAVMAWEYPMVLRTVPVPSLGWSPARGAEELLNDAVEEAYGVARPEGLSAQVIEGSAAHVLIERSRGARLLIVGSRGLGGFMGLLLGSVSAACAEHAACPVLVMHGPDDGQAGVRRSP